MSVSDLKTPGFLVLVLVGTATFLLGTQLPGDSRLMLSLQDSGHFLIFTLLMLALLWPYRNSRKPPVWPMISLVLLFGLLVELVQSLIGRQPSLYDLLMNLLGVAAGGILFFGLIKRAISPGLSLAAAALLALAAFSLPIYWLIVYQARAADFPHLINTESAISSALIKGSRGGVIRRIAVEEDWRIPLELGNKSCLYVSLQEGRWPGVSLFEPSPDWGGYDVLVLAIYSDQAVELPLTLRINDQNHNKLPNDRYNRRFTLHPGINRISVPLEEVEDAPEGREMDLSAISRLMLYTSPDYTGNGFCLLSMALN
ncbi:MAG: VanZ family protein [Candidatus Thiodiazotropha sp.]